MKIWISEIHKEDESGFLILAWVNLGSLIEGTMKFFLSVWHEEYKDDIEAIKKMAKLVDPDCLKMEPMRQFFKKRMRSPICRH